MNIIRQSNEDIIQFLGGFQKEKAYYKYRFNKYCMFIKQSDRYTLIYNSLVGGIVQIKNIELENINSQTPFIQREHLIQNYYLVREDFDEDAVIQAYRESKKRFTGGSYLENPFSFVIMTTSDCNARCPYCYELGLKNKQHMSEEVMEKTIEYIIDSTYPQQDVEIMFFGGEPLYNRNIIDNITTRVRGAERNITTSMTTNGYLFDGNLVEVAAKDWNLRMCQITLDGTQDYYNKTKRYIYKDDPNPFARIIRNIHLLLNKGIEVSIRINVGMKNIDNVKELLNYLFEEFKGETKLSIYPWEIFQDIKPENSEKLYGTMIDMIDQINLAGFRQNEDAQFGIKYIHCMVDSGNTILINERGEIGLCEHYIHDLMFSNLDNPQIKNQDIINSWLDYVETDSDICKGCKIRPVCLKMKKCTDEIICDEYARKYYEKKVEQTVLNVVGKSDNNEYCEHCNK